MLGGADLVEQFFLLTLYMQQVLHYSALQTGVAYVALTLAIVIFANVSRNAPRRYRVGIRRVLRSGLLLVATGLVLVCTPAGRNGHYYSGPLPALLSGIGMWFSFIPITMRRAPT